jgi:hypothetical protein
MKDWVGLAIFYALLSTFGIFLHDKPYLPLLVFYLFATAGVYNIAAVALRLPATPPLHAVITSPALYKSSFEYFFERGSWVHPPSELEFFLMSTPMLFLTGFVSAYQTLQVVGAVGLGPRLLAAYVAVVAAGAVVQILLAGFSVHLIAGLNMAAAYLGALYVNAPSHTSRLYAAPITSLIASGVAMWLKLGDLATALVAVAKYFATAMATRLKRP